MATDSQKLLGTLHFFKENNIISAFQKVWDYRAENRMLTPEFVVRHASSVTCPPELVEQDYSFKGPRVLI